MDESKFITILQAEERAAVGYRSTEIATEQEDALAYYEGDPFGNEEEGHSSVISRDVMSTIDSIMPDLMRVFVSSDTVVEFEPETEADEEFATQATDYANYIFYKDNDGYTITHDLCKDGLLFKVGIVKSYWDDSEELSRETYAGLTEEQVMMLSEESEIIEATQQEDDTMDVTVMRVKSKGRVRIVNVPPEEFLVKRRTSTLRDAVYTAHKSRMTIAELLALGFDEKKVMGLSSNDDGDTLDGRESKRYEDEGYLANDDAIDPMMREVWVLEEYILSDFDEDKKVEMRKVTRVNKTILENVEVDEHPFSDFCPNRMPHKIFGKSVADETMDIQLIKSTLLRQGMDNLYMTNNPRIEVPEMAVGEDTFDDLLTTRIGAPIRTRGAGGLTPLVVPFTASQSFQVLEYWDGEKEQRTGVTRYNQGLDADSLNKTATGVELIQQKGMAKTELKARNLANTFGDIFSKILRLIVKYQDQERTIKLRGKWTPIKPDSWNANMRVTICVGLGTGDKSERVKGRSYLLQLQEKGLQLGMVKPEHLYKNLAGLVKDLELGDPDDYFPNPEGMQQQGEKPPSPEEQKVQGEMQAKQAEMQMKQQIAQAERQMKQQQMHMDAQMKQADAQAKAQQSEAALQLQKAKAEADIQIERERNQMRMEMESEKAALGAELARDKANAEMTLANEKMIMEGRLAEQKMQFEASLASHRTAIDSEVKLSKNRPGGDLNK